jgi:hypothetical protein
MPENRPKKTTKKSPPKKPTILPLSSAPKKTAKKVPKKAKKPDSVEEDEPLYTLPSQEEDPLSLLFPEGLETLLEVPYRKELPQLSPQGFGPKERLPRLIKDSPKAYARMIGLLRNGVSPNVAAEVCGIVERTFYQWGKQGQLDAENIDLSTGEADPIDSYYSRFYLDVRRAIAVKASECEMDIAAKDSRKWLSVGPGRIFGNAWSKNPEKVSSQDQLSPPADEPFAVSHTPQQRAIGVDGSTLSPGSPGSPGSHTTLPLSTSQEYEALKVLEGIAQLTMSDAMKKAYDDQLSLEATTPSTDEFLSPDADLGELLEGEVE